MVGSGDRHHVIAFVRVPGRGEPLVLGDGRLRLEPECGFSPPLDSPAGRARFARMSTLAPAPTVASVSLAEANRNPVDFSDRLGRSFERYGFAIISDHGIPADLIARAEEKAKQFF